ncbi:MAG: ATPase [Firmicutes bacterium HGW-Firmicutes-1]|jgi:D-xylose transport system substrate-binding protein|nr:MAG: ATPase [Firmicutes bacterium HGW-Firmicutes-1]
MKKLVTLFLVLVMMTSVFAGCAKKEAPATDTPATDAPAADAKIRVGISLPTQREERWVRDKEQMIAEAAKLGVELVVKVADADTQEQIQQVEAILTEGVDVLILAPNDASASASLVDMAKEEGVPVIAYDRLITGTANLDYYISFDNTEVGRVQGKFITDLVPEGNYIIMSGAPTDNNAKLFKEGAMEYLQPLIDSGKIKVVAEQAVENWEPENALKIVEAALLSSNNEVDAILSPNDGCAGGAIQALAAQGLDGQVPITGQDAELAAAQRIVAGTQTMTVFKDTRDLASKSIQMAMALAKGEAVETNGEVEGVPSVLMAVKIVTKDNVKEVLVDSGYLKEADVFK